MRIFARTHKGLVGLVVALTSCAADVSEPGERNEQVSPRGAALSGAQRGAFEEHRELLQRALRSYPESGDRAVKRGLEEELERVSALLVDEDGGGAAVATTAQALTDGDGCSAPKWADIFLGVVFQHSTSFFTSVCQYHDRCYTSGLATYGVSRKECDDTWLGKLVNECDDAYPAFLRFLLPSIGLLWVNCQATAQTMYAAVRVAGEEHFWDSVCIDGQTWPASGTGPGCSSYETFDGSRQRVCGGVSGMHADGSIGPNWEGCRGSGCAACTDALAAYPYYFDHHPHCSPNGTCAGQHYTCGAACPEPTLADAIP